MSAPALTVRYNGAPRTFPGHDVVVGRDLRADIRIPHLLVSRRAHVACSTGTGGPRSTTDRSTASTCMAAVPGHDLTDGTVLTWQPGRPGAGVRDRLTTRGRGRATARTSTVVIPPKTAAARPPQPAQPSLPTGISAVVPAAAVSRCMRHRPGRPPAPAPPQVPTSPEAAPAQMGHSPARPAGSTSTWPPRCSDPAIGRRRAPAARVAEDG